MQSISARLLAGTALVLAVFVVLTALSVSYSVHQRAETALIDRLQGLVYGILGATEINEHAHLVVNDAALPDQRLNQLSTGLYAELIGYNDATLWQSASTTIAMPEAPFTDVGEWVFERIDSSSAPALHQLHMTTVWELENGDELPFVVHVATDAANLSGQLRRFDRTLWASLLVSALCLLLVQLWVLHRSLQPLKRIGSELNDIEQGRREALNESVPRELAPLAHSINTLLVSERNRHKQYRHLLDDLAHSLKTPLSVLRNIADASSAADTKTLDSTNTSSNAHTSTVTNAPASSEVSAYDIDEDTVAMIGEQTTQMQNTLKRYLQRATMRTPQTLAPPLSALPVIQRLAATLEKVFARGSHARIAENNATVTADTAGDIVHFDINVRPDFHVRLSDVDLYEILGNVLENACKYGASSIRISAEQDQRRLIIDDNGPGFPEELMHSLTERGVRADTTVAGQGLGLAASRELLQSYGGELVLGHSPAHGARVVLRFP